jgi:hypothetical protein
VPAAATLDAIGAVMGSFARRTPGVHWQYGNVWDPATNELMDWLRG